MGWAPASLAPAAHAAPVLVTVSHELAPVSFELELPVSTWQGRYLQNGCGGYCGMVEPQAFPSCDATLGGDFAMATDNEGHVGTSVLDGTWAFNDQQLRLEYGYLSEHTLAVVAKTIIHHYYGTGPAYSYYNGCSDGGREAMEVAQRYPEDFNGVIAGAPEIIAAPLNAELQTWNYRVNTDAHGGKLIMWHGWADQGIPPFGTIDYYDVMAQRIGGLAATRRFARLFMFPTVYHCGGGYGPVSFDPVLPMVNWVENHTAPAEVIASQTGSDGSVTRSRPVYPYPLVATYNGSGPPDNASSFHAVVSPNAGAYTPWIGGYLFRQPDS